MAAFTPTFKGTKFMDILQPAALNILIRYAKFGLKSQTKIMFKVEI